MNNEEFWVKQFRNAGICIVAVVAVCNGSCQLTNYRVAEMVKSGADPIVSACAVSSANMNQTICAMAIK